MKKDIDINGKGADTWQFDWSKTGSVKPDIIVK
jgi:hypothetical protein